MSQSVNGRQLSVLTFLSLTLSLFSFLSLYASFYPSARLTHPSALNMARSRPHPSHPVLISPHLHLKIASPLSFMQDPILSSGYALQWRLASLESGLVGDQNPSRRKARISSIRLLCWPLVPRRLFLGYQLVLRGWFCQNRQGFCNPTALNQLMWRRFRRMRHICGCLPRTALLQVCPLNNTLCLIFYLVKTNLCTSIPLPLYSSKNYSGVYKNPTGLMNVRQNKNFSSLFSKHFHYVFLMASSIPEDLLLSRESEVVDLEDEPLPELDRALNLTLAGKLLANVRPSVSHLTFYASRSWDCINRLTAYEHGNGLYSFEFILDSDVLRVVQGGPWFVEGKLLLIQRMNPNQSITQLSFDTTKIWVRCFDLPPKGFNIKYAKAIGGMLGCFCESDLSVGEGEASLSVSKLPTVRKYLRIKVSISLYVPLKRTQSLKVRNPTSGVIDEISVRLAYERLPLFCYRCGLLGHEMPKCNKLGPNLYGDWIRAEKHYRNPIVSNQMNLEIPQPPPPRVGPVGPSVIVSNTPVPPHPMSLDPKIILANFKHVREEGPLPALPITNETSGQPLFGSFDKAIVRFEPPVALVSKPLLVNNSSVPAMGPKIANNIIPLPNSVAPETASILGPVPKFPLLPIKNIGPIPHLPPSIPSKDSVSVNKGPNYFNPTIPNSDMFSPKASRCLFKTNLVHPAFSTTPKAGVVSPPSLSPLSAETPCLDMPNKDINNSDVVLALASADMKGKGKAKRSAGASSSKMEDSPRPKRGRPPIGATKNA